MIDGRHVLAIIPARGGSKGLPGKNIRDLCGKPLIAWSIEHAGASRYVDRTIVSSDDEAIIEVARAWGAEVPFVRPAYMATDTAPIEDAIVHCLDNLDQSYEIVVLLQPTSPLRTSQDIDACLDIHIQRGGPTCVTVTEASKPPFWTFQLDSDARMSPILAADDYPRRRQDMPGFYNLNGAVYVADVIWFRQNRRFLSPETRAYVMPKERSVDVDDAIDFALARAILEGRATA